MQSTGLSTNRAGEASPDYNATEIQQKAEAMRKLMFGAGMSELNLRAMKERGMALRNSIEEMIDILAINPHMLTWENTVERFGVITTRHQQLAEQLRPLTKFYIARPVSVNQSNAELIPLLLSTMKLPEMDKEELQALQNHQQDIATQGLVQLYERLGNTMDGFNKILEDVTKTGKTAAESGCLNPKGVVQQSMALELKQALDAGPTKVGPDESAEAQALLAAVLKGQGLS